jgi:hypothetical protein
MNVNSQVTYLTIMCTPWEYTFQSIPLPHIPVLLTTVFAKNAAFVNFGEQ